MAVAIDVFTQSEAYHDDTVMIIFGHPPGDVVDAIVT